MLNAALYSTDAKQLWSIPDWLPEEIGIIVENGQFYCYENEGLKAHLQRAVHNIVVYKLVGLVAEINSNAQKKPHLVSMIDG